MLPKDLTGNALTTVSKRASPYRKDAGNGNLGGIVVLCAEPKSLTVVSITGILDPSELADLGGHFGIPKLDMAISIHGKKADR